MRCPICFGKFDDVGDGYECRECGYFLEYDEIDEYDEEDIDCEGYYEEFCDLNGEVDSDEELINDED